LKHYCNQRSIGLIGDIPIFVAHDSADVWANRTLFQLDRNGRPKVISGYPADAFAPRGQRWGHPHYRWSAHVADGFAWWMARFAKSLAAFNAIRIDHFLGFYRVWAVAASARDAVHGNWVRVPGDQIFTRLRKSMGDAPIIAEDLGSPVAAQLALRDKFKFPGMRILQFGFGGNDYHLPHVFPHHCVAYTGTHDNQTIVGWFESLAQAERDRATAYVGVSEKEQHWNFIRALFTSVADTVIIPVQDALGSGAKDRMNVPGVAVGNWGWRMDGPMPRNVIAKLRALSQATGRLAP
jgi:4-alpha-glucanotransferase